MSYNNKWINQIIKLQKSDGSWGNFHTLGKPIKGQPISTEQALRRLWVLGLTDKDEPINHSLQYMKHVLDKRVTPPDRREKVMNWDY